MYLTFEFQGFLNIAVYTSGSSSQALSLINCKFYITSVVATAPDILSLLSLILECVLKADQQMMERTKTKIFSALISVLQIQGLNSKTRCHCLMLQESVLQILLLIILFTRWRYFPAAPAAAVCVWDSERRGSSACWQYASREPVWRYGGGWRQHGDRLSSQLTERPERWGELSTEW